MTVCSLSCHSATSEDRMTLTERRKFPNKIDYKNVLNAINVKKNSQRKITVSTSCLETDTYLDEKGFEKSRATRGSKRKSKTTSSKGSGSPSTHQNSDSGTFSTEGSLSSTDTRDATCEELQKFESSYRKDHRGECCSSSMSHKSHQRNRKSPSHNSIASSRKDKSSSHSDRHRRKSANKKNKHVVTQSVRLSSDRKRKKKKKKKLKKRDGTKAKEKDRLKSKKQQRRKRHRDEKGVSLKKDSTNNFIADKARCTKSHSEDMSGHIGFHVYPETAVEPEKSKRRSSKSVAKSSNRVVSKTRKSPKKKPLKQKKSHLEKSTGQGMKAKERRPSKPSNQRKRECFDKGCSIESDKSTKISSKRKNPAPKKKKRKKEKKKPIKSKDEASLKSPTSPLTRITTTSRSKEHDANDPSEGQARHSVSNNIFTSLEKIVSHLIFLKTPSKHVSTGSHLRSSSCYHTKQDEPSSTTLRMSTLTRASHRSSMKTRNSLELPAERSLLPDHRMHFGDNSNSSVGVNGTQSHHASNDNEKWFIRKSNSIHYHDEGSIDQRIMIMVFFDTTIDSGDQTEHSPEG